MATEASSWVQVCHSRFEELIKDSCRPRKLVPGLAAIWLMPRLWITSTMKSELAEPCKIGISAGMPCSMRGLGPGVTGPTGRGGPSGWPAVCALAASGAPTAAAPASPAPFSKPRRLSLEVLLILDMDGSVWLSVLIAVLDFDIAR